MARAVDLQRARQLFEMVVDLDPAEQLRLLEQRCANEPQLKNLVVHLLAVDHDARDSNARTCDYQDDGGGWHHSIDKVTQIGPYVVERMLGQGGMSSVYLARKGRSNGRRLAVKVLRRFVGDTHALVRFHGEGRMLAKLDHPLIPKLVEVGIATSGFAYMVVDYVAGIPLLDAAQKGHWSLQKRLSVLTFICDALMHAHRLGIIHCDIKNDHVLVDEHDQPRLLDFGIAAWKRCPMLFVSLQAQHFGGVWLTPAVASPEQVQGGLMDERTDVYGLSSLAFQLLSGGTHHPFAGTGFRGALQMIVKREPRLASETFDCLSDEEKRVFAQQCDGLSPASVKRWLLRVDQVLAMGLARDPVRRFPNIAALKRALENLFLTDA